MKFQAGLRTTSLSFLHNSNREAHGDFHVQESLYPGEEDIETWTFGDRTEDALLTFQVGSQGLHDAFSDIM